MNEQLTLAIPEPAAAESLDVVMAFTSRLEVWVASTDDLVELEETRRKVGAIETYLRNQHDAAAACVELARADRRLEIRIGELLGPANPGARTDRPTSDPAREVRKAAAKVPARQRRQFRTMAGAKDHPDVAAAVDAGASRAEVVRRAEEVTPLFKSGKVGTSKPAASSKIQPPKRCPMCGGKGTV